MILLPASALNVFNDVLQRLRAHFRTFDLLPLNGLVLQLFDLSDKRPVILEDDKQRGVVSRRDFKAFPPLVLVQQFPREVESLTVL